jgi:hypothetical protein
MEALMSMVSIYLSRVKILFVHSAKISTIPSHLSAAFVCPCQEKKQMNIFLASDINYEV